MQNQHLRHLSIPALKPIEASTATSDTSIDGRSVVYLENSTQHAATAIKNSARVIDPSSESQFLESLSGGRWRNPTGSDPEKPQEEPK